MRKLKAGLAAAALMLLSAAGASAATFTGNFGLSGSAFSDPGLVVNADPMTGPVSFDLEVGESTTFHLFDIWTDETWVNQDDLNSDTITASFNLTHPEGSGSLDGSAGGFSFIFGLIQGGYVSWGDPLELAFGNGGLLLIDLSDAFFNKGLFGLNEGQKYGAPVYATVTYAVAPIPLPAAAWLLGGALAGLGLISRRRRAVA